MPAPSSHRFSEGAAEADAGVLDEVMPAGFEVAFGLEGYVNESVAAELGDEVVEHAVAGFDVGIAIAVQVDSEGDLGFAGGAFYGCFSVIHLSVHHLSEGLDEAVGFLGEADADA